MCGAVCAVRARAQALPAPSERPWGRSCTGSSRRRRWSTTPCGGRGSTGTSPSCGRTGADRAACTLPEAARHRYRRRSAPRRSHRPRCLAHLEVRPRPRGLRPRKGPPRGRRMLRLGRRRQFGGPRRRQGPARAPRVLSACGTWRPRSHG